MRELSIEVKVKGEKSTVYKFNDHLVTIGRDESCVLSICHEVIPRELCQVWFDIESENIHLEEHPNLTNPLCCENKIVSGGV